MTDDLSNRHPRKCTGHKSNGDLCERWAVAGGTVCPSHGGRAPQVRAAAQRRQAEAGARRAMATYGTPVEVDPLDALLGELWRTAGHVQWLGELIGELEHETTARARVSGDDHSSSGRSGLKQYTTDKGLTWEKPAVWVELYQHERAHLARVATDCLKVGIEERRVRLAEDQGRMIAGVMRSFAVAMGLDPATEAVRMAMRQSLTVVTGAA